MLPPIINKGIKLHIMQILLVSSEYESLIKIGGLSDFTQSLARSLKKLGHDVRVLIPFYKELQGKIKATRIINDLKVDTSVWNNFTCAVNVYYDQDLPVYLLEHQESYYRDGIYDQDGVAYYDNPLRYALLSKSSFSLQKALNWQADIMHASDWQASLVGFYLKEHYKKDNFFIKTKSVLTIHNGAYQGRFDLSWHKALGIDNKFLCQELFEDLGAINLLKAGINLFDELATVSPSYREELLKEETSHGLYKSYIKRRSNFKGIVNGVDQDVWCPNTDKEIIHNFDKDDLENKELCKKAFLKRTNINKKYNEKPLFAYIGRVVEQKGFTMLLPCLKKILAEDISVIVIGHSEPKFIKDLQNLSIKFPKNFRYIDSFSNEITRNLLASADFLLMPSLFEPCGLSQLYAMRYGTIPIVRSVGGLKDTVLPTTNANKITNLIATGYKFTGQSKELTATILRAKNDFLLNNEKIKSMQQNAMSAKFSWQKVAQAYVEIYKKKPIQKNNITRKPSIKEINNI